MKHLILNLVKKHLLKQVPFKPGMLVKNVYGDIVYEVSGVYYSTELIPVLFIRDSNGHVMGTDPIMYEEFKGSINI